MKTKIAHSELLVPKPSCTEATIKIQIAYETTGPYISLRETDLVFENLEGESKTEMSGVFKLTILDEQTPVLRAG